MSRYLNEEGLRVVASKVNKKQDSFITGNSLEFITVGQGEIDNLLYLDANNELVTISPQPSIGVDIGDPDKALGLANQLLKVETMGFLGGSNVTIVACSPQTPVGAVEGDVIEPTQSEILFGPADSFSAEFRKWCETYGLSIQVPMEQSRTLTFYISVPQLSVNKALKYVPDDSRTSDENSWSASYTKMQVRALMPAPLVSSETATIEDSSVDTWGRVEGIKDSNEDWIDSYSDVVDGFLLQKFLLSSTGGTELPSTMTVKLRNKEIYYGYFGIEVTCNGIVIGQTVYPENEGSNIFENNVGITWNYWIPGDYTVVFDNSSTASVQKINVTGSEDSEARETAAGAIALAQQAIDNAGPSNYSTSEQDTGKIWIDGKKIYRKYTATGTLPNNTRKFVPHNVSNLNQVIGITGMAYDSNANQIALPFNNIDVNGTVVVWVKNENIVILTSNDLTSYTESFVIIEYTKN